MTFKNGNWVRERFNWIEFFQAMAATAMLIGLGLSLTAHGAVGIPNENGCGLGSFPLVRYGYQQDRHEPPMFIHFDFDGDDNGQVREGRSDTGQMLRHEACVDVK